jgi:predicted peroxiredoxin
MILWQRWRVLLLVALVSGVTALARPGDKPVRDGLFVHVSHGVDQPHRALMPLKMAAMMAEDHDVLVYLDIEAVNLALKEAPAVEMPPYFPSSRTLLTALLDKGVTVMVCPTCLKVAGKTEADLLPGVRLADKAAFFSFTKGRIVTLDY